MIELALSPQSGIKNLAPVRKPYARVDFIPPVRDYEFGYSGLATVATRWHRALEWRLGGVAKTLTIVTTFSEIDLAGQYTFT